MPDRLINYHIISVYKLKLHLILVNGEICKPIVLVKVFHLPAHVLVLVHVGAPLIVLALPARPGRHVLHVRPGPDPRGPVLLVVVVAAEVEVDLVLLQYRLHAGPQRVGAAVVSARVHGVVAVHNLPRGAVRGGQLGAEQRDHAGGAVLVVLDGHRVNGDKLDGGVAGHHLESVGEAGHVPPGVDEAVLHLVPLAVGVDVVVVAHGEVPWQEPDAGVGVHIAPRLVKLIVRGRADSVAVDVVSSGHDEVAVMEQAPSAHGRGNLVLVVVTGAPISDDDEAHLFI